MWTHALLEIYVDIGGDAEDVPEGWPTEGSPATWIEEGKVGYCDGLWSDAVAFLPLYKLLWWKLCYWWATLTDAVRYDFYWRLTNMVGRESVPPAVEEA